MKHTESRRIGILGTGHIGKTLARQLASAGHSVKVANSRGPETIAADVLETGAVATDAATALRDVQWVILSVPLSRIASLASLIRELPEEVIIADTSNYYPHRDGTLDAIVDGQVESLWVAETLGRPIVKAWNAIGSDSLVKKALPPGSLNRLAIPVAGDLADHRQAIMQLVNDSGFDPYDAGSLAESWRQQPGAPCYCTDLTRDEMGAALASAELSRLPARRDIAVAAIQERMGDNKSNPDADYLVGLHRVLFM
ncbi:NADPH-dependent F420 reductase [Duffyella gerundensis]|uniref:NADPH-dependent F420 reductase n=1 Tax=Duffyella gerundensis TaxID=1619313 RepID=UPI003FD52051